MSYSAEFIESQGEFIDEYIVDESFEISNAGSAEVYRLDGQYYEIITWNTYSFEHSAGSKTINNVTVTYSEYENENF